MGGGDLNLKKSWHPLLMKNQERVWQEEKKAIDERKRTQQLLKEQAEERQIQELQRLGGKREERVDWLYNAPAAGSGQNTEEMEAYLLGKKSVEQLFQDQDRKRLEVLKQSAAPASGSASTSTTFQAIGGNANSVRDLAAKIRDDPLLAIKRQEQKAYEELMKNPKRLQELRAAREGREGKPSKKHKHKDGEHKHRSKHRHDDQDKDTSRRRRDDDYEERSRRRRSNSFDERDERKRRRSVSPPPRRRDRSRDRDEGRRDRRRSRSPPSRSYNDRRRPIQAPTSAQIPDAAARLAAMTASAAQIHKDRDARLAESDAAERAAEEREAAERQAKMVKGGGRLDPTFLKEQQEKFMKAKLEARG